MMKGLRGTTVQHGRWGRGRVTAKRENTITVSFVEAGEKMFLYPDAFDGFLVMEDAQHAQAIAAELEAIRAERATREAEKRAQVEADALAATAAEAQRAADLRKQRAAVRRVSRTAAKTSAAR